MEQKRYESDMTPKEKRELERKKLKQMTAGQKLEYIWAYYKPHMAVVLGIILLIVFIGQMLYRSQFDTVFYAAIINGTAGDGETLAEDFKNYTGDTDKYHEYTIDNSMYLMKDQEDYQMVMKLSTIIGAQQVDVLIAPEYKFQEYVEQNGFYPMSELLTDEQQEAYKDDLTEYIGFVDDERLWRQINAALKKTFGLWLYNTDRIGDIRCLCPKCLNDYFRNPNYVVRRLDPFAKSKGTCDKCNDRGWDYIVYDKRTSFKGKGV